MSDSIWQDFEKMRQDLTDNTHISRKALEAMLDAHREVVAERDSAVEQVVYWRERALDAEGREQTLAAHVDAVRATYLPGRYETAAERFLAVGRVLDQSPETNLARLIAQKQADAVSEYASRYLGGHEQELAEIYAGKLRRQAEESNQ